MAKLLSFGRSSRARSRSRRRRWNSRRWSLPTWITLALLVGAGAVANAAFNEGASVRSSDAWRGSLRVSACKYSRASTCVVDGDTIRFKGEKIRLSDIDAPEVFSPSCSAERARGERATGRLVDLINAGPVEIVSNGRRDTDRYGRKLRIVARGGHSLGAQLVREGLARRWDGTRRSWC